MLQATLQPTQFIEVFLLPKIRLRAVSYFSLQSYCTRNLSTRAARPFVARNEGVNWPVSIPK